MQVTLGIPDTFAAHLASTGRDPARTVLESLAVEGYRDGVLSEEDLRRMLSLETSLEVHAFLDDHGVDLNYSYEDWEQDKRAADYNLAASSARKQAR